MREEKCHGRGCHENGPGYHRVALEPGVDRTCLFIKQYSTDRVSLKDDGRREGQMAVQEAEPLGRDSGFGAAADRGVTEIAGEEAPVARVNTGAGDCGQRAQGIQILGSGAGVIEGESGRGVLSGHAGEDQQVAYHGPAKRYDVIDGEPGGGQQQHHAASGHDDEHQLAGY